MCAPAVAGLCWADGNESVREVGGPRDLNQHVDAEPLKCQRVRSVRCNPDPEWLSMLVWNLALTELP